MVTEQPAERTVSGRRRDRSRVVLSVTDAARIRRRLTGQVNGQESVAGFVCSSPWAMVCIKAIEAGRVQRRKNNQHIERDLIKARIYPPGGTSTSMIEHAWTMRWMPPDYVAGNSLDDREDRLTLAEGCKLPRSASAINLDRIRYARARPEKQRLKTSRN